MTNKEKTVFDVLESKEVDGFSFCSQREIAKILGVSVSTVHRHIERMEKSNQMSMKAKGVYKLKKDDIVL